MFIFVFLDSNLEGNAPNDSKHSPALACSYVVHEQNFDSLRLFPNTWNCPTLLEDLLPILMLLFCRAFWSPDVTIYLVKSRLFVN